MLVLEPVQEIWFDPPTNLKLSKYQVSRDGKICNKMTRKVLKPYCKAIYPRVGLTTDDDMHKNYQIHRILALTFITNPENKPTVDHINRNPQDYGIDNLRWATYSEQNANKASFKHKESKVIAISNGNIIKVWDKASDAISEFPDIKDYLIGEKQHEYFAFCYLDKVILPGEVFKNIDINDVTKCVSNLGRVYNKRHSKLTYGKNHADGYMRSNINGGTYLVSRLIGFAFVERPPHLAHIPYENLEINHIDGNKKNNIFSNLDWTNRSENVRHAINILYPTAMPAVIQYSLSGKFIAKHQNSTEAAKTINKPQGYNHIRECCQGSRKTAYTYIWKYDGDELKQLPINSTPRIPILQYTLNGEFVREYPTIAEASRLTGICETSIGRCCKFELQTAGGFIWRKKITT